MTFNQLLTIFGIVVSAGIALLVASMHRRQMRQIELFKQDPSVGLIPQPTRLTTFVASRWDDIFAFTGPIVILVVEFTSSAPITRITIFNISVSLALLLANFILLLVFRVQRRLMERLVKLSEISEKHLAITERLSGITLENGHN